MSVKTRKESKSVVNSMKMRKEGKSIVKSMEMRKEVLRAWKWDKKY